MNRENLLLYENILLQKRSSLNYLLRFRQQGLVRCNQRNESFFINTWGKTLRVYELYY
jgi:hypothetical protein